MTVIKTLVTAVVGLALSAGVAHAQTCQGRGSFRDAPHQVSAGGMFQNGARGVGVGVSGGGDSVFGGVDASFVSYNDLNASSKAVGANIGEDYAVDRVHVCPAVAGAYIFGPNVGNVNLTGFSVLGGVNVGVAAAESSGMSIVPTVGAGVLHQRAKASFAGIDQTSSQTGGLAAVGVGIVFNRRIALVPLVEIPFGFTTNDRIFNITLAVNFGQ
jgi:hypothetical protein